ncbi:hypothetical protein [Salmonirosea aquatica]|uniref:Uncharacterized protein n=1 Tax=Salmonirosea aquatica TaxID=2654236 RepID=A0A7C9BEJ3_9BACT|nr:hypothetical protein [Cytophagaceae bacterium SJW1-29]
MEAPVDGAIGQAYARSLHGCGRVGGGGQFRMGVLMMLLMKLMLPFDSPAPLSLTVERVSIREPLEDADRNP